MVLAKCARADTLCLLAYTMNAKNPEPLLASTPRALMSPGGLANSGLAGALDRKRAVERAEHATNALYLKWTLVIGIPIWFTFCFLDWAVTTYIKPGNFRHYVLMRALCSVPGILSIARLFMQPTPSRALLRFLDLSTFTTACVGIALMTTQQDGLMSAYTAGVTVVLALRSSTMSYPWKEGAITLGVPTLGFVLTVLLSVALSPTLAHQLHDPAALITAGQYLSFTVGTGGVLVYGSHTVWRLRRQVFETRTLGRYKLKRRIGTGGMGEVWAAHDSSMKRDVAVKIMRPDTEHDPLAVARFEREVRATSELAHPNTVRVFDHGVTEDGIMYYVMELLEGRTLTQIVQEGGPQPEELVKHHLMQAARALAEAHARGIVHRDIKPDNLFITTLGGEADFLKVLDFGVARVHEIDVDIALTHAGVVVGTPIYMAPEIANGTPASPASDIYALGAVGFFLLAGKRPFEGPAAVMFLDKLSGRIPSASAHRETPVVPEFEAIIRRCLDPEPRLRFSSAEELLDCLVRCTEVKPWVPPRIPIASPSSRRTLPPPSNATLDPTTTDTVAAKPTPRA